jgi:hypothetical protein
MRRRRRHDDATYTATGEDSYHYEFQPDQRRGWNFDIRHRNKFERRNFGLDWRSGGDDFFGGQRHERDGNGTERGSDGQNFDCDAAGKRDVGGQFYGKRGSSDDNEFFAN